MNIHKNAALMPKSRAEVAKAIVSGRGKAETDNSLTIPFRPVSVTQ